MLLQNYPSPLHRTIKSILIITFPKRLQAKHQSTHYPTPKATRNIRECGKLNKIGFIFNCMHRNKREKGHIQTWFRMCKDTCLLLLDQRSYQSLAPGHSQTEQRLSTQKKHTINNKNSTQNIIVLLN